jgi:Signal transduction histidine kinase regulating citrate/malate metabolism
MSLYSKMTLGIAVILCLSAAVTSLLNVNLFSTKIQKNYEHELGNLAGIVAQFPEVQQGLKDSPYNGVIQDRVQRLIDASQGVDQIIVCNMQRIRYSHTNPEFIGLIHDDADAKEVLYQAKRYFSYADPVSRDSSGGFIRAYAPVFDGSQQIGYVVIGTLAERVTNDKMQMLFSTLVFSLAGICFGIAGAAILAQRTRRNLLGLELEEITRVYREHSGLIEALHEGVVAINNRGRVSMINKSARRFLGFGNDLSSVTDIEIDKVLPNTRLPNVISTGQAEFDYEKMINGRVFIANMVPVRENGRVVGAVETFQDKTQIIRLAEELTGVKQLVDGLRANSHEFSNKLHVILGLLELSQFDQAKQFIQATQQEHGDLLKQILKTFKEPMIAGLMLGKFSVAREQGVELSFSGTSHLGPVPDSSLSHALVLILGNLVDNAMESVRNITWRKGRIVVNINDDGGTVSISVEDNGEGVAAEHREAIFRRGFSTKGEGRGTGLHLVKQELELFGGTIGVDSTRSRTVFRAKLPVKIIDN